HDEAYLGLVGPWQLDPAGEELEERFLVLHLAGPAQVLEARRRQAAGRRDRLAAGRGGVLALQRRELFAKARELPPGAHIVRVLLGRERTHRPDLDFLGDHLRLEAGDGADDGLRLLVELDQAGTLL